MRLGHISTESTPGGLRRPGSPAARPGRGPGSEDGSPAVAQLDEHRRLVERRDRWRLKRAAEGLLRGTPIENCHRSVTGGAVRIMSREGRTFFHDIAKCKSRWACPVCSSSAVEKDHVKLRDALAINKARGGETYLLTFTIRHDRATTVKEAVAGLLKAQSRMKSWRAYKAIMASVGALGSIASREITFGVNGPHPHVHMLVLAMPDQIDQLEAVRPLWSKAVKDVGLDAVNEHGFDVRGGDYAAEYVAKFGREPGDQSKRTARAWWTAADEMTKGHTKSTKRLGGATPFTLLRWYAEGDAQAGAQFVEFYEATRRRAMLHWSRGLRARLDLFRLERPKEELAPTVEVVKVSFADWHAVMRNDAREALLVVAERHGAQGVAELLERLRRSTGSWRGEFRTIDAWGWRLARDYYEPPAADPWPAMRKEAA